MKVDKAYVTGFDPYPEHGLVHHFLLRSCRSPRYYLPDGQYALHPFSPGQCPVCQNESIIYGWGYGGERFKLPKDASFYFDEVMEHINFQVFKHFYAFCTKESSCPLLMLQIHFAKNSPSGDLDTSTLILPMQELVTLKRAEILLVESQQISIPPGMPSALVHSNCLVPEEMEMYASCSHTHMIGKELTGYKVDGKTGKITQNVQS